MNLRSSWKLRSALAATVAVAIYMLGYHMGTRRGSGEQGADGSLLTVISENGAASSPERASTKPKAEGAIREDERSGEDFVKIIRTSNSLERAAAWANLIKDADAEDLKRIAKMSTEWYTLGGSRDASFNTMTFREGQVFRQEALDKILPEEPNGRLEMHDLNKMRGWASVDPMGAKEWLDALEDGSVKESFLATWYEGAVSENPHLAAELYDSLPASRKSAGLGPLIDSIHKNGGLDGLREWFNSNLENPAGDVPMQQAFENFASRLGQGGGGNAAGVEEVIMDPKYAPYVNSRSFARATYHMAEKDPGHVVDLVARLSEQNGNLGERQIRTMLSKVIDTSTRKSINNMGHWLADNADHALYDMSVRYFVQYAARTDREAATEWAKQIGDEGLRAEAEQILGR